MTSIRALREGGAPKRPVPFTVPLAAAAIAVATWLAPGRATSPLPPVVEQVAATITEQDLRAAVGLLASDALAGRGVGHAGNDVAARYLAAALQAADLAPLDRDGFLRPLPLTSPSLGAGTRLAIASDGDDGETVVREAGEHFQPVTDSADGRASGRLAFAGHGISAPAFGVDDYAGLDVDGRIVLAFEHVPADGRGEAGLAGAPGDPGSVRAKALAAHARGARALLLVPAGEERRLPALDKAWPASPSPRDRRVALAGRELPIPVARISTDLAASLVAGASPAPLDELRAALARRASGKPPDAAKTSFPLGGRVADLRVEIRRSAVAAHNVIGMIEGRDPVLREGAVLVGAHFDHDGLDAQGRVFNGADDNASGVAGVLEVAEAFGRLAELGTRPRRSVVFALWNAEEHGLLGSRHVADALAAAGRSPAAVLNLDMIGRDEDVPAGDRRFDGLGPTEAARNRNALHLLGYTRSPGLLAIAREENAATGLTLKTTLDEGTHQLLRRSDQWPFLQVRVPALFFFTGLHPDYHTPDDDVEKLNFEKMTRIVRLVYRVAWRVAEAPIPPAYVDAGRPTAATRTAH